MQKINTHFEIEAGAIVTKIHDGKLKFLTIHRIKMNDYTLPKGHVEVRESLEDAARREVYEETGHRVEIENFIDSFEYKVKESKDGNDIFIIRRVYYFSGSVGGEVVEADNPDGKEGKTIPEWLSYEDALKKFTYDTDKNLIKKVYFAINVNANNHIAVITKRIFNSIKSSDILFKNILKFGVTGSFNDGEFSNGWSDLDYMFIIKSDNLGNINESILIKLRELHTKISLEYPNMEISFLTHTYDDFEKYVAFEYLNHYKVTNFLIENDLVNFQKYIEKIIKERNIPDETKKRYAIYHLRHFRFNLLRKVVSTSDDKHALKLIIDKLVETMILYMTYYGKSIQGKDSRLQAMNQLQIDNDIIDIFREALDKRKVWKDVKVNLGDIDKWIVNFERVLHFILKDNLYNTPEELITDIKY